MADDIFVDAALGLIFTDEKRDDFAGVPKPR